MRQVLWCLSLLPCLHIEALCGDDEQFPRGALFEGRHLVEKEWADGDTRANPSDTESGPLFSCVGLTSLSMSVAPCCRLCADACHA